MTSAKSYGLKTLFAVVAGAITGAGAVANFIVNHSPLPSIALGVAALASLGLAIHFASRAEDTAAGRPSNLAAPNL